MTEDIIWNAAPTSEQQVSETLRALIIAGKLPVGTFLSQRKLAEISKTSVISVRGALRQLENEGLVENVPRMGVRIPQETPADVRDRYFLRTILETAAVKIICGNLSDEIKNKLIKTAKELDRLIAKHEKKQALEFARIHHDFHLLLAECTGSRLLQQMLKRVINPSLMMLNATRSWNVPSETHQNHTALINAIISGNTGKATAAIQSHIQVGLESELSAL